MNETDVEKHILTMLLKGHASPEQLVSQLGIGRTALDGHISALKAAGIALGLDAHGCYRLYQPICLLSAHTICAHLPNSIAQQNNRIDVVWEVDSTNQRLMERPPPPSYCVDVMIAERQLSGRGRRGRKWASPLAAHIYLSLCKVFTHHSESLAKIGLATGIIVAQAMSTLLQKKITLKWPNDLMFAQKKLGGILVERGMHSSEGVAVVIGLGLNVRMPARYGANITQPWSDLETLAGRQLDRNMLVAQLLGELLPGLALYQSSGIDPFIPAFAAIDALRGRNIHVAHATATVQTGLACGLSSDGGLQVLIAGQMHTVYSGEVSIRAL